MKVGTAPLTEERRRQSCILMMVFAFFSTNFVLNNETHLFYWLCFLSVDAAIPKRVKYLHSTSPVLVILAQQRVRGASSFYTGQGLEEST
jgi:hypothetical protein